MTGLEQGQSPLQPSGGRRRGDGARAAFCRLGTITAFGVLPALALVAMFAIGYSDNSLAADFHHEIYPQLKEMLAGRNPYPAPDYDPTAAPNLIWPPLVAFLLSPLALLSLGTADVVMVVIGLGFFAGALWLMGLRDWRVYGLVALWPSVAGEMRVSHLTPLLALLIAGAWRFRDTRRAPGALIGLAVALKFFVWPVGLWLAAMRRNGEAFVAALVVAMSMLLVLPFTGLDEYARSLLRLGGAFDQDSYTVYGLLVQGGASDALARGATFILGGSLLAALWRCRSLALAVASALVLSPIVWLDYFALAAIPLVLARPRLSPIWFAPLATWGVEGAGLGIGDVAGSSRLLLVFAVVLAVAAAPDLPRFRLRRAGVQSEPPPQAASSGGRP